MGLVGGHVIKMLDGSVVTGRTFLMEAGMKPTGYWKRTCYLTINGRRLLVSVWERLCQTDFATSNEDMLQNKSFGAAPLELPVRCSDLEGTLLAR